MKKMLAPRYMGTFILFFITAPYDLQSNDMTFCRKPPVSSLPKQADKMAAIVQMVAPVVAATIPPPMGVISPITLSIADALDYSRRISAFLEGLKNWEANREGNLLFHLDCFICLISFTDP
jgi:hypothetical protein